MEIIYQRDLDAFKGPKTRAREQAFRHFRSIITIWSALAVMTLPLSITKLHA
jgi:hypothetical protein